MPKRAAACYGIRKGRGAPVVVHSWAEVVAKVGFPESPLSQLMFVWGRPPTAEGSWLGEPKRKDTGGQRKLSGAPYPVASRFLLLKIYVAAVVPHT